MWDLSTNTTRQIDARFNLWDHSPPIVDPGSLTEPLDCDRSGSVDIRYNRDYALTLEPGYAPQKGTSGCVSLFTIPY